MLASGSTDLEGLPPTEWPELQFNWDTSPTAYLHTVDPPSGLVRHGNDLPNEELSLGWAALRQIDELLAPFSKQANVEDFWQRGAPHRSIRVAVLRRVNHRRQGGDNADGSVVGA